MKKKSFAVTCTSEGTVDCGLDFPSISDTCSRASWILNANQKGRLKERLLKLRNIMNSANIVGTYIKRSLLQILSNNVCAYEIRHAKSKRLNARRAVSAYRFVLIFN